MRKPPLNALLEQKEYAALTKILENKAVLTEQEKFTLIEAKVGLMAAHEAHILYEKFHLQNVDLLTKIYLLSGEQHKCIPLLKDIQNPYLKSEVLIACHEFVRAVAAIKNEALNAKWYEFMGRCFRRNGNHEKAIECLRKASELYSKQDENINALRALVNLGALYESEGNAKQASYIFRKVEKLIEKTNLEYYPQSHARILINTSLYYQNTGNQIKALASLAKALQLLKGARNSHDFIRASLLLGSATKESGHFKSTLAILEKLNPTTQRQKLDRARYLMIAYAYLGEEEKANKVIEIAQKNLNLDDKFGIVYLDTDIAEVKFKFGAYNEFHKHINNAIAKSEECKNTTAKNYALTKFSFFKNDASMARAILPYHLGLGYLREAHWNQLTIGKSYLAKKAYKAALENCKAIDVKNFPLEYSWLKLIKAVALICLGKIQLAEKEVHNLLENTRGYDIYSLHLAALYLLVSYELDPEQIAAHFTRYDRLINCTSKFHVAEAQNILSELNAIDRRNYQLRSGNKISVIDQLERLRYRLTKRLTVLDFASDQIFIHSEENKKLSQNPIQWKFLKFLAQLYPKKISKAELIIHVFEKKIYNPLTDDNSIYVTVNRIRKTLGVDILDSADGSYQIKTGKHIILITRTKNK